MKLRATLLLLLAVGFSSVCEAGQGIAIKASIPCPDWTKWRTTSGTFAAGEFWVFGYLSGIAIGTNVNFLDGVGTNAIEAWMDNYCKGHPLDTVADGAKNLAIELARRSSR